MKNDKYLALYLSRMVSIFLIMGFLFFSFPSDGDDPDIIPVNIGEQYVYVGGTGPMNYTSIQEAHNDVSPGGIIFVYSGVYHENILIKKPIIIQGEDIKGTILDGGNMEHVIVISGGGTTVQGITIRNSGINNVGIFLNSSGNIVSNCYITNHFHGIHAAGVGSNTISNCTFFNNSMGLFFDHSNNNSILYSTISHNEEGLYLYEACSNNNITQCTITHNIDGMFFRDLSNFNSITQCTITQNEIGVRLWDAKKNNFFLNTFKDNDNHTQSIISDNLWYSLEKINYSLDGSQRYGYVGNYWDDYTGSDEDGDGLGDYHYEIDADDDDNYPIMPQKGDGIPGFELWIVVGGLVGIFYFLRKKESYI